MHLAHQLLDERVKSQYLSRNELLQTFYGQSSPKHSSDGGETRVIPAGQKKKGESGGNPAMSHLANTQQVNQRRTGSNAPSVHVSLLHEPGELPLGQHGVVEVEPGVLPDVGLPEAQGLDDPVELLIAIVVLGGSESVGHALQAVHDGTGKVIGRVDAGERRQHVNQRGRWRLPPLIQEAPEGTDL